MKTAPNSAIEKLKNFIRQPYAWPGGYPLFGIFGDGEACCKACAKSEFKRILADTLQGFGPSFQIVDVDVNWEDQELYCAHCNVKIESAYGGEMNKLEKIENGTIRTINAYFRANDTSHKWPIRNRFNVTERAIRRLRRAQYYTGGLEYFHALDSEISTILNSEV